MYKEEYSRDDMNTFFVLRKKGERGLAINEDWVNALVHKLEKDYKKKAKNATIYSSQH